MPVCPRVLGSCGGGGGGIQGRGTPLSFSWGGGGGHGAGAARVRRGTAAPGTRTKTLFPGARDMRCTPFLATQTHAHAMNTSLVPQV